jgi:hypothetical protein
MPIKLKEREFYCVKDRKKVIISEKDICFKNIKNTKMPSGNTPALVAYCKNCDCNLTKFIPLSKVESLKNKYETC